MVFPNFWASEVLNICDVSLEKPSEDKLLPKQEKGKSHSIRPVSKRPPSWCRYEPEEVEALIIKLAREGHPPSRIGTILRDQHGIPLTKPITGKRITRILSEADMALSIPEDLEMLLRKASRLSTHLERNKMDLANKRSLQIIEAKIHKLSKYYKQKDTLPSNWKYEPRAASIV
ncbi:MAG: 30S ribosomal protein S15 [Candidatus Bathyarchaeota archaeon]|nr:MAG: 30S ribosomal protein S15 [Candidatus Bathyarchaeota archaeon]